MSTAGMSDRSASKASLSSLHSKFKSDPLSNLRDIKSDDVASLCRYGGNRSSPRLAKDEDYANAVLRAWREEENSKDDAADKKLQAIGSSVTYQRKDGKHLFGYLVSCSSDSQNSQDAKKGDLPGVLLFHTGAGPQDIFLRWKAESLATNKIWGERGCVVFIADNISDAEGWAWSDRERYASERSDVLGSYEEQGDRKRWKLRDSIQAALDVLRGVEEVDSNSIAALGWCVGGHSSLELGLIQEPSVKALISYHGVFDGVREANIGEASSQLSKRESNSVLICNGKDDPFVEKEDVENTEKLLKQIGYNVLMLNFDGVKHGFTNPAQDYNPSEAFAFNEYAAEQAWEQTLRLLKEKNCN